MDTEQVDQSTHQSLSLHQASPARGPSTGGIPITISGQGFQEGMRVQFAGVDCTQTTLIDEEHVRVSLPANPGVHGPVEVRLVRKDGETAVRKDLFAYYPGQVAFGVAGSFPVDNKPTRLAVEDVNGDGKLDVMAASSEQETVSVLLGKGNGTFVTPATSMPVTGRPRAMVLSEMTGDGRMDMVVASDSSGVQLQLFSGNGNGTFQRARGLGQFASAALALGDYNADGKIDLAVPYFAFAANGIAFLYGKGDGTFSDGGKFGLPSGSFGINSADFNGDGKGDLAVTLYDDRTIGILLSQGTKFGSVQRVSAGIGPYGVVAADFNGDSKADLVVSDPDSNSLRVFPGNGNGTFQTATVHPSLGSTPRPIATTDLNLDGWPDLVCTNVDTSGFVTVFLNNGQGRLLAAQPFAAPGKHLDVAAADLNGDRLPDLIVTVSDGSSVLVLQNQSK